MEDGGKNGVQERILSEVLALAPRMGRLEGELAGFRLEMAGCNQHLRSIDRRLEAGSSQMHAHGTAIAEQELRLNQLRHDLEQSQADARNRCHRHSEALQRLGRAAEDTGVHVLTEQVEKRASARLRKRIAGGVSLLCLLAGTFGLGKCDSSNGCKHAAPSRAADARR